MDLSTDTLYPRDHRMIGTLAAEALQALIDRADPDDLPRATDEALDWAHDWAMDRTRDQLQSLVQGLEDGWVELTYNADFCDWDIEQLGED